MLCVQVLLHAGPAGMKVAKIVETAQALGLVAADWVKADNKNSRSSQISNAIRNTDVFVHVGDHRYAIATFPGIEPVPLKTNSGVRDSNTCWPSQSDFACGSSKHHAMMLSFIDVDYPKCL